MVSKKTSTPLLKTIAGELETLANDLKQQQITLGSSCVDVGDPLFFKTKQKLKNGKVYYTLSFQVPLVGDHEKKGQEDEQEPDSPPSQKKLSKIPHRMEGQHPSGKALKKEISRLWKDFGKHLAEGSAPPESLAKNLIKKCNDYCQFTDHAWHDKWLDCVNILKEAVDSAISGNFEKAQALHDEVNRSTKSCHKAFK